MRTGPGQFASFVSRAGGRAAAWTGGLNRQAPWPIKVAALTFLFILAIPVAAIILLAIIVAAIVFGILMVVNAILRRLRRFMPRRDGRENVRVIVRDQTNQQQF